MVPSVISIVISIAFIDGGMGYRGANLIHEVSRWLFDDYLFPLAHPLGQDGSLLCYGQYKVAHLYSTIFGIVDVTWKDDLM